MEYKDKVREAYDIVYDNLDRFGNDIYVAFSGGKDSKALLSIIRDTFPYITVVHNAHEGEDIGEEEGILTVKPPKSKNPQIFLDITNFRAQFDGTRKDEDDYINVNGTDIHRSQLTGHVIESGLFDLTIVCPLLNWTEEDVYRYLEEQQEE